ncbi:hypothetical protein SAMN05661080_03507 [Modestobacter sp. DSM 44400]|uniref:hypothetical protein n=1 Tax=Modestobacter sp. DSM 44400 TaxID=1550230 RepID=UPI0008961951|nr:hypothetical protein [Modestobacter sp. DSM 44400]SDY44765.1 hypothetical protein SAMN05661080_03507 [Modestobacter sp. DSM 44400]
MGGDGRDAVELFVSKLASEGTPVSRRADHDEVVVVVDRQAHRLWITPESAVGLDADPERVRGPGVTGLESAARLLLVHWDESLATREPHPSGWWTYQECGFDPLPPGEAHHARHR